MYFCFNHTYCLFIILCSCHDANTKGSSSRPTCPPTYIRCQRGNCVHRSRICDFVDDCGDLSDETLPICVFYDKCDFDRSMCEWRNAPPPHILNWQRVAGSTSRAGIGANRDHTTGLDTGGYVIVHAEISRYMSYGPSTAHLISRAMTTTPETAAAAKTAPETNACQLVFYYRLHCGLDGSLAAYVRYSTHERDMHEVWRTQESTERMDDNTWLRHVLTLSDQQPQRPFEVVLAATPGRFEYSSIAVDDTVFSPACKAYNDSLPAFLPTTAPSALATTTTDDGRRWVVGYFRCQQQQQSSEHLECVLLSRVCDYVLDCQDGSDELNCSACTFEHDMCGWRDASVGYVAWERTNASSSSSSGPHYDHSHNAITSADRHLSEDKSGHFVALGEGSGNFLYPAVLMSPALPSASSLCTIGFYYYANASQLGNLDLLIEFYNQTVSETLASFDTNRVSRIVRRSIFQSQQ